MANIEHQTHHSEEITQMLWG